MDTSERFTMLNLVNAKNYRKMNDVEYYALLCKLSALYDEYKFDDYELALFAFSTNEHDREKLDDAVMNHRAMMLFLENI